MTQSHDGTDFWADRFWAEDDLLAALRADIAARAPRIQIQAEAGAALTTLLMAAGARRVLEIGTLFGYSGVWIGRALPEDGTLDTLELSPTHAEAAREWFDRAGLGAKVTVHVGAALDTLRTLTGPYDAVFLDADKTEYPDYLDRCLPLLRPGGLLIADNLFRRGAVAGEPEAPDSAVDERSAAVRVFADRIASDPRLQSTVLPLGDGLSVSVLRG
ncbi:putative O-methyltransferase YrrM [Actinoalloteichus hoggarensis]|uniref:Putative O-methyltransferase n=1 Tax=Actinoalloteichus hoggarensis TaxID=1470176 RepID=A0A221WAJ7_9PSEU|nr:O-methyltransferase [Actinoalloteichus hoggarensis]ASO22794.1 Putative O-methyltransferase [Actinoalloteichus hoggarensis]MBB5924064.1 putative O-methyltransferase YrrM [Actinoalloteichus hoggarensis]